MPLARTCFTSMQNNKSLLWIFRAIIAFHIAHPIENSLILASLFCFNGCNPKRRKYEKLNLILPTLSSKSQFATSYFEFANFCDHSY
jgi:hypothetical protein